MVVGGSVASSTPNSISSSTWFKTCKEVASLCINSGALDLGGTRPDAKSSCTSFEKLSVVSLKSVWPFASNLNTVSLSSAEIRSDS